MGRGALKQNCSILLISPTTFIKNVSEEGVIAFYRTVIHKIADPRLRVILYHIPQFSGVPITLKIIENLRREFPNTVIGLKESEGNLVFAKTVIESFPGLQVFVGNEGQIIEAVHYGASGTICGIANMYPEVICSLYEQGKASICANPQAVEEFFQALKGYQFISAFKTIMENQKGSAWHLLRPPLLPLNTVQKGTFLSNLKAMP